MKMSHLGTSLASIVTIAPPRNRRMIEPLELLETGYEGRSDQEALWSDFCAVGLDLRMAMIKNDQAQTVRQR